MIVDALLGTGFRGEPRGGVAEAIDADQRGRRPGPQRRRAERGRRLQRRRVAAAAVRAAVTVSFHAAKPGLWIHPGKAHAGELQTLDIGIPRGAPMACLVGLITPRVLDVLPRRRRILDQVRLRPRARRRAARAGSRARRGWPREASMRAGAGYVTACVPASLQGVLATAARPRS